MKDLALRVSLLRVEQGMTPSELCERSDVLPVALRAMEEGDISNFGMGDLLKVARVLGMTVHVSFKNLESEV